MDQLTVYIYRCRPREHECSEGSRRYEGSIPPDVCRGTLREGAAIQEVVGVLPANLIPVARRIMEVYSQHIRDYEGRLF